MPSVATESMAIADVYAEALLETAREQGREQEVAAEFADLIGYLVREPDVETFLTSRSVDDDARRESLERLFRGKMSDPLLNLLQVLNRRNRSELIRMVWRCVQLRLQEWQQQREVIVATARPLTDALRVAIKKEIKARIGKEALLIEKVQPDLIGGVIIRVGDEQIDGSVASSIRSMHDRLIERGMEEIRGGRGYEVKE